MWCCFTRAPEARVLELGEVADLGALPDVRARPEVGERADVALVLDARRLDDAGPDAAARADRASTSCDPAADRGPLPDRRRAAEDDVRLEHDVLRQLDGRSRRRPSTGRASSRRPRMWRSLMRTRSSHSAWASWARSLMPIEPAVVLERDGATIRPSARAIWTRSVRYSSPVADEG